MGHFFILCMLFLRILSAETCIRVGEGTVAQIHQEKLRQYGITTLGVIDIDPLKKEIVAGKGLQWLETYDQACALKPSFWDVCVPTEDHLLVMKKIMRIDPEACILVEKPICMSYQVPELRKLLTAFQGKIVVNENYLGSEITGTVVELALETLHLRPRRIAVEMDKNRIVDFKRGRFVDPEGAFKYEGTHILTILQSVLEKIKVILPMDPASVCYEPLVYSDQVLENQGSADIQFKIGDLEINLFSSMNGTIKNHYPPYDKGSILEEDISYRYRILAIGGESLEGNSYTVVGFYEPLATHPRSVGEVVLFENGKPIKTLKNINDDSMGKHLGRAADYLLGKTNINPCPVELGIENVQLLDRVLP